MRDNRTILRPELRQFARPYTPALQSDEVVMRQAVNALTRSGTVPLDQVIARLDAQNLPPQLVQRPCIATIAGQGPAFAVNLVPKNPNRKSFLVTNTIAANFPIFVTYDTPAAIAAPANGLGIPIPQYSFFSESNGAVSINDIWVFCNATNVQVTYPITVLGYEGTLALTGNPPPPGGAR